MANEFHIYDGSQYREVEEFALYDGSQWRNIEEAYVFDGTDWRLFFSSSATVTLTNQSISHSAATAIAGIYFNTDGTVDKREGGTYTQISTATDWVVPNGAGGSGYAIQFSGVSFTGSGFIWAYSPSPGSWQSLGTQAYFYLQKTSSGTGSVTFTVSIRDASTLTVLDTATVTLQVTVP
jgi:hypothetical protein